MSAYYAGADAEFTDVRVLVAGQSADNWGEQGEDDGEGEHVVGKGRVAVVLDTMDDDHLILSGKPEDVRRILLEAIELLSGLEPAVDGAVMEAP